MLGSPITITIDGTSYSLIKINQDGYSSEWRARSATDLLVLYIRHSSAKRNGVNVDRHNVELVHTIFATSEVAQVVRRAYYVYEVSPEDTSVKMALSLGTNFLASESFMGNMVKWDS
jgi:hypothetical protein